MAEGDSLVRIARNLRPVMEGAEIVSASAPSPRSSLRMHASRLEGRQVESVETRGKHLLVHLDEGLSLHSHLGMNGGWRVDMGRGFGKPERSAWLLLDVVSEGSSEGSGQLSPNVRARVAQFGGTTLRLVRTVELARDPRLATLGPDILADDLDLESAAARLRSSPDQIGVALLDQKLVCGIGNIFKSEACFEARIDPWRTAGSLSRAPDGSDEAVRLLEIARRQMLDAVETGRRPGRIYKKTGRPCRMCRKTRVRSRGQGDDNRTTYWCPNCQS
ncbi:MAG: Fpg/Nei family DNA glycosylase [Solirubrobacterales bacterium]|nr:Fpg/Nei family DNA glycosylase [Solirubrobacterales bacterium]